MRKKIFVVALAACLLILSVAGSSMAYFTDTEQYTNVFTAGNVNITLTANGQDASTVADILGDEDQNVYPGKTVDNEVVISNVGTEDAYVGAVITLTSTTDKALGNILSETAGTNDKPAALSTLLNGLVSNGTDYDVEVVPTTNGEGIVTGYTIYIVKTAALVGTRTATTGSTTSATIFTDVVFPSSWDNAEMAHANGLQISVKAYATQTAGMNNGAIDALQKAFPGVFPNT